MTDTTIHTNEPVILHTSNPMTGFGGEADESPAGFEQYKRMAFTILEDLGDTKLHCEGIDILETNKNFWTFVLDCYNGEVIKNAYTDLEEAILQYWNEEMEDAR